MPRSKRQSVAPEKHRVRLIQLVPSGTPGAYGPDPIMGAYWSRSRAGMNGIGGFVSVEEDPTLNDASQIIVVLPEAGSDGISHGDRLYCLNGSVDPTNPTGPTAPYFPGDEWFEVLRGYDEIVASGTPVDPHVDGTQGQIQLTCLDVLQLLKKTRETAGGFWVNAPRDVFEHYTRLWLNVLAEGFTNSLAQFPNAQPTVDTTGTTPDGRWTYENAWAASNASVILFAGPVGVGVSASIRQANTWTDPGATSHSCWRAEVVITALTSTSGAVNQLAFSVNNADAPTIILVTQPDGSFLAKIQTALGFFPATALANARGSAALAIEARDRWYLFYLNGQLLGTAPRRASSGAVYANLHVTANGPVSATVDGLVVRRTSPPMNGGLPGDYFLPSPPTPGGLNGEYFDMSAAVSGGYASTLFGSPTFSVSAAAQPQPRLDPSLNFGAANPPAWQLPFVGAFGVRWTGAIYLPLGTQDVVFALPTGYAGNADFMRVWVGRTRAGEQVLTDWPGDTAIATSAGMRSLLGSTSGWYPILVEYYWNPTNASPPWTGNANPAFTYNVGGSAVVPDQTVLAPVGLVHQQIRNDSHYDAARAIADQFVYQFRSVPTKVEDPVGPFGYVVPRARVGRDTEYVLTEAEGINPQLDVKAEDVANALLADASGLGGTGSGALSVEAFNYQGLAQHPFISSELENLPQHTFPPQLITNLLSLLGYRSAPWEDVQAESIGTREVQDTFPLTGALAEFDWQPGDGVRVRIPSLFLDDATPRQILALKRMLYQDGLGQNAASFRPRIRSPEQTLRRFIRQVYGARRTFQGQIVNYEGTHVQAPSPSEVVLPNDLSTVRQATLVVLSKADTTSAHNVQVNGTTVFTITKAAAYDLGPYVAKNVGAVNSATEPRMLVALTGGATAATYCLQLRVLVPAI